MLGDKTKFSLDRFKLSWKERDAIGVAFTLAREIEEFFLYLNNIGFDMDTLPPQARVMAEMENAINYVTLWKDEDSPVYSVSRDLKGANSDYYYSDIIFKEILTINADDLMDFLKG